MLELGYIGSLARRFAVGFMKLVKMLIQDLLLGGDPVTGFLTLCGLSIWAVTFGVSGYVVLRAVLIGIWRWLTAR